MIPQKSNHNVTAIGVKASGEFGISKQHEAFVMSILRSQIYTDKHMAVLREYSTNAWDANRAAGRGDVPIEVELPTSDNPTLRISDCGPGLSQHDVFEVFAKYGASTKRENNDSVGMLGIGSKAAFCYTDSFFIISKHGGVESTYVAALDESEKGIINLLREQPCETTGLTIQVTVNPGDCGMFLVKANTLYPHFNPQPKVTSNGKAVQIAPAMTGGSKFKSGIVQPASEGGGRWYGVMGCVPYRIDLNQFTNLPKCVHRLNGMLDFQIGDVQMSASREELSYTDTTKEAILAKLDDLISSFVIDESKKLESAALSPWQKRLVAQRLVNDLQLQILLGKGMEDFGKSRILFEDEDNPFKTFTINHMGKAKELRRSIDVSSDVSFYIKDTNRAWRGYRLGYAYNCALIVPNKGCKLDAVRAELAEVTERYGITGIPTSLLSEEEWHGQPRSEVSQADRLKHRARVFRFAPENITSQAPASAAWEVLNRVPQRSDVYVIIRGFETEEDHPFDIFKRHAHNMCIAKACGVELPPVYGYKDSAAKPLDRSKIIGRRYEDWEKAFHKKIMTRAVVHVWETHCWAKIAEKFDITPSWHSTTRTYAKRWEETAARLGERHPVTKYINRCIESVKVIQRSAHMRDAAHWLGKTYNLIDTAEEALNKLLDKYPLMCTDENGFGVLWIDSDMAPHWAQYLTLIDRARKPKKENT